MPPLPSGCGGIFYFIIDRPPARRCPIELGEKVSKKFRRTLQVAPDWPFYSAVECV
jgi:hypothetical protein